MTSGTRTGGGDADLAAVASLLAEPARARILLALGDGRPLPASTLAAEAGVAASTASSHLARLVDGGLLTVTANGRHRYYRLAGPHVGRLIETLAAVAPARPIRSLRDDTRARALRTGRTCYDHLAGRLGVDLFAALIDGGYVVGGDGRHHPDRAGADRYAAAGHDVDYRLTRRGRDHLAGLRVDLPAPGADGTNALRYCVDWTEQRHHLAGAVGRALAARLFTDGWLARAAGRRVVTVTDRGRAGLAGHFALTVR
jgi:DNA-binding transcriptional ArsR family regulator